MDNDTVVDWARLVIVVGQGIAVGFVSLRAYRAERAHTHAIKSNFMMPDDYTLSLVLPWYKTFLTSYASVYILCGVIQMVKPIALLLQHPPSLFSAYTLDERPLSPLLHLLFCVCVDPFGNHHYPVRKYTSDIEGYRDIFVPPPSGLAAICSAATRGRTPCILASLVLGKYTIGNIDDIGMGCHIATTQHIREVGSLDTMHVGIMCVLGCLAVARRRALQWLFQQFVSRCIL